MDIDPPPIPPASPAHTASIDSSLAQQFRQPSGRTGLMIASLMHQVHQPDYGACLALLPVRAGLRLLEIGMASAGHLIPLADAGVIVAGLDWSDDMVTLARAVVPPGKFHCGDVCDPLVTLPACDAALAVNSLCWWPEPETGFAALHAALADAHGLLAIGSPAPPRPGSVGDQIGNHGQRYYSACDVARLMLLAGFNHLLLHETFVGGRPYVLVRGRAM